MSKKAKVSPGLKGLLFLLALFMLTAAYCIAAEIHKRGTFVDDTLFAAEIRSAAQRYQVDPQLVRAVVFQESRFKADAIGRKGEVGLMQVMPRGSVADWARVKKRKVPAPAELLDAELNLEIGVWYLARALNRWKEYKEQIPLALIQYNAGEGRAVKWKPEDKKGEVIPAIRIPSTRAYVTRIMERYSRYVKENEKSR